MGFCRQNEWAFRWVCEDTWRWRREVELTNAHVAYDSLELLLDGLDTVAQVYWNSKLVHESHNFHRSVCFSVALQIVRGVLLSPGVMLGAAHICLQLCIKPTIFLEVPMSGPMVITAQGCTMPVVIQLSCRMAATLLRTELWWLGQRLCMAWPLCIVSHANNNLANTHTHIVWHTCKHAHSPPPSQGAKGYGLQGFTVQG